MRVNVRMGELKVADTLGDELAVIGLGSCIALALCDADAQVAGLAHVVLSSSPAGGTDQPGKYADTAVPALLAAVLGAGARRHRLSAAVIGGARMFATGLDIGARNAEAVTAALLGARMPINATDVGGSRGRTVRVHVGGEVTSQLAGEECRVLLELGRAVPA
jgi:chemotaxis protein CheD